jgi:hypothetical protein
MAENEAAQNTERAHQILEAAKAYREQTGDAGYILVQSLEQQLGVEEGGLQKELEQLEVNQKIEVLKKSQEGQFRLIRLTHWAIRDNTE